MECCCSMSRLASEQARGLPRMGAGGRGGREVWYQRCCKAARDVASVLHPSLPHPHPNCTAAARDEDRRAEEEERKQEEAKRRAKKLRAQ